MSSTTHISTDIVSRITLASRAALEIPVDFDEDVHETIGMELDLNLLFRDFPMIYTNGRFMPLSIDTIAKDNLNKAFLSTAETPGSTVPHGSMSGWTTHRMEGDQVDPDKVFVSANLSEETFDQVFSQQILEMSVAMDSSNVRIKDGVVAEWLDTVDKPIQGNIGQDNEHYKNFLHAFANSKQLEDLLRSSVAMSLSDVPQPNRMEGGGTDPSEQSVAFTKDSLQHRTDFKNGKVFPTQTNDPWQRWTSFLKLRQGDAWMFKLQLSIHDSEFKESESRMYRFILRQKDSFPREISQDMEEEKTTFTVHKPEEVPNSLGTDYTGSLAYLGLDITRDGVGDMERCINTNSMFHTGKALDLKHIKNPSLKEKPLEDGFVCALVPANPSFVQGLTAPIFAVAQSCIKKKGEVGVITQLHPIRDQAAQLRYYLDTEKCLVVPAVDWMDMKNEADDVRRPEKLFQRGEDKTYPTCHVKVHAGSGVEFTLHFGADGDAGDDPNADTTLAPASRLTKVELTKKGEGYYDYGSLPGWEFYQWVLRGTNGEYDHAGAENINKLSFEHFMNTNFQPNQDGEFTRDGDLTVEYGDEYEPILAHDPYDLRVHLVQTSFACKIVSMSDSMRVPLFHNQDVQGLGTKTEIEESSCSIYSHPFQNHQTDDQGDLVVNQPIQQNQAQDVEVQWPPQESLESLESLDENNKVAKRLFKAGLQYETATPYVETGGFGERGNYHDVVGTPSNLALPSDTTTKQEYKDLMEKVKVADMSIYQRYRHDSKLHLVSGFEEQWFLEKDGTVDWSQYDQNSNGLLDNVNWSDYADADQLILNVEGNDINAADIAVGSTFTTSGDATAVENAAGTATFRQYRVIDPSETSVNEAGHLLDINPEVQPYKVTNDTDADVEYSISTDSNVAGIRVVDNETGEIEEFSISENFTVTLGPDESMVFYTTEDQQALSGTVNIEWENDTIAIQPSDIDSVNNEGLLMVTDSTAPLPRYKVTNDTGAAVDYEIDSEEVIKMLVYDDPLRDYGSGEIITLDPGKSIVFYLQQGQDKLSHKIHIRFGAQVQIADIQNETRYYVDSVGNSLGAQQGMRFTATESAPAEQSYANYNGTAIVKREVVYSKDNIQQHQGSTSGLQVIDSSGEVIANLAITNNESQGQYTIAAAPGLSLSLQGGGPENDPIDLSSEQTLEVSNGQTYHITGSVNDIPDDGIKVTQLGVLNSEITAEQVPGATVTYIIDELSPIDYKVDSEIEQSIAATEENHWLAPVTANNIEAYPSSDLDDHARWPKYRKIITRQKVFDVLKKSYALDSDGEAVLDSAAVLQFSYRQDGGETEETIQIQVRLHEKDHLNLDFAQQPQAASSSDDTIHCYVDVPISAGNQDLAEYNGIVIIEGENGDQVLQDGHLEFLREKLTIFEYLQDQILLFLKWQNNFPISLTHESTERGVFFMLELQNNNKFTAGPIGFDAAGDQDSLPLRIEGDHSPADQLYATDVFATRMECWPFASQGVRFELKQGRVALAEDPDERQLPRLSLHDQGTLVRVELADLDATGGGSIVVPMNMGIQGEFTVDLHQLRHALYSADKSRLIYRDYTVRVHFFKPEEGGSEQSLLELDDNSRVQVDNEAKQITYEILFSSRNEKLLAGDNSELTTQDVITVLSNVEHEQFTLWINGEETGQASQLKFEPLDASQETILSDTNFLEAPEGNLFSYSGGVDLEHRWYHELPFKKLQENASYFEFNGIPDFYNIYYHKLTEGIGGFRKSLVSMKAGLQEHLGASLAAHFRFYGEVGAFPNMDLSTLVVDEAGNYSAPDYHHEDILKTLKEHRNDLEFTSTSHDGTTTYNNAVCLYLADRNFTMSEKVTPVGLGKFVNVNHSGGLLPFKAAQDGVHKDNFPRDFIVRACYVVREAADDGSKLSLEEDLQIEYDRSHLTSDQQNTPSKLKCYPLVCNGDQARVAQIKLVQSSA